MDEHLWFWVGGIALLLLAALVRRFTDRTPRPLTDEHIARAARAGDAAKAIRWHRELHGSGLAEAKRAVDQLVKEPTP